ncbi:MULTISPECIES: hypothetical protein [Bacillus]|uniref:hypothetical protein n=1 Tax=Bacillus TaxID=1386 RepID=UPI000BB88D02|nr:MULTISPECIES: hypothetical protein [Bacillus]
MKRRLLMLCLLMVLPACSSNNAGSDSTYKPYGHYEDDKMIGFVWEVDDKESWVIVDISEWEKRKQGPNINSDGYSYQAFVSEDTIIKYENGDEANLHNLKKSQKVLVNPPNRNETYSGEATEIILLNMTYEEKFKRVLSHLEDKLNIVIIAEEGKPSTIELEDIISKINQETVGAYIPYDENYVVDYKEEFGIVKLPVILVTDHEKLLYKAYDVESVINFLNELESE